MQSCLHYSLVHLATFILMLSYVCQLSVFLFFKNPNSQWVKAISTCNSFSYFVHNVIVILLFRVL